MMFKRTVQVLALISALVLFSSCAPRASLPSPTPAMVRRGDHPTYVNVSDCSTNARLVIESKGFPDDMIHLCEDERVELDTGEEVNLVKIQYGEGMDCPAGCIYESYVGIITQDQTLIDLPNVNIETAMWGRPPFNQWRTWWTENHSSKSHQEVTVRNGHYGWVLKLEYYKFTRLYWKSYGSDAELGKTLYTATGEIFVYLNSNGEEVWDYSRFEVSTKELQ